MFANNEQGFVAQYGGEVNAAELQAMQPVGHFLLESGVEHLSKLVYLLSGIVVGVTACEAIEFLVIEVFWFGREGSPQFIALAHGVLATALRVYGIVSGGSHGWVVKSLQSFVCLGRLVVQAARN